jgi:Ca2+-binding RTX toxin-like protein
MANPNINIVGSSAVEGSAPNKLTFTISLSEALTSPLTLNYSTSNGTAISGKDYTAITGSITFAAGDTTVKTITVAILNDDISEVDKNLFVNVFIPKSTTFNPGATDLLVATAAGTITDTLLASTATNLSDTPNIAIENLTLTGSDAINGTGNKLNNVLTGNSVVNTLKGADGNDTLDGKGGLDILEGGNGNDTYIVANTGDTITELTGTAAGIDTVQSSVNYNTLDAHVENLILTGTAISGGGNELGNFLTGNELGNSLSGEAGNDTLQGNGGIDTLTGGAGDDIYIIVDTNDTITEDAEEGKDTVRASLDYTLTNGSNIENIELVGIEDLDAEGDTGNNKLTGNRGDNTLTGLDGNDTLEGGTGDDTLEGGLGNDEYVLSNLDDVHDVIDEAADSGIDTVQSVFSYTLQNNNLEKLLLTGTESINGTGNDSDNTLTGNSGNNILDGLAGDDTLVGMAGNDTYIIGAGTDDISEAANAGTDTVQSSINHTLETNVENLLLTGTATTGTGNTLNNSLIGNSLDNILSGSTGNDTLDGGAGNDTLTGGAGNDVYVIDAGDTIATESSTTSEIDLVKSSVSHTLVNNLESLELLGTDNLTGTGNTLNNKITGNSGNNSLVGNDGNDSLDGGAGNDTLNGGVGNDSLDGGLGIDSFDGGAGNDTLKGGNDNDSLLGSAGSDSLDGGLGADTLNGGAGSDTYVVDNSQDLILLDTEGTDTVQSSISYRLTSDLEHLTLTGSSTINGTGNDLDNTILGNSGINTIDGGIGKDSIDGGAGNDILKGGAGDDTLKGNSSNDLDTLVGGAGNDEYYVDSAEDVIIENSTVGTDKVLSTATSYTLSDNVEDLTLSGTANINGTGNSTGNTITGNTGSNFIDGGAGDDTMVGGTGNDIYMVDSTNDVITESSTLTTEIDIAFSSANFTLANNVNVEKLILTGTSNLTGIGNTSNNILIGNDGNNTLTGSGGNDILDGGLGTDSLVGGTGDDVYVISDSGDVITEALDNGLDTAQSSIATYTLANNVENLVLLGTADLTGIGNSLANRVVGNSGNNDLRGGRGHDTLIGGSGADKFSYTGNTAFSSITFGLDHIVDFDRSEGDKIGLGRTTFGLSSVVGDGFSVASEFAVVGQDEDVITSTARIVYNSTSGDIFYNADGIAEGGESVVTTLDVNSDFVLNSLSASDFTII